MDCDDDDNCPCSMQSCPFKLADGSIVYHRATPVRINNVYDHVYYGLDTLCSDTCITPICEWCIPAQICTCILCDVIMFDQWITPDHFRKVFSVLGKREPDYVDRFYVCRGCIDYKDTNNFKSLKLPKGSWRQTPKWKHALKDRWLPTLIGNTPNNIAEIMKLAHTDANCERVNKAVRHMSKDLERTMEKCVTKVIAERGPCEQQYTH